MTNGYNGILSLVMHTKLYDSFLIFRIKISIKPICSSSFGKGKHAPLGGCNNFRLNRKPSTAHSIWIHMHSPLPMSMTISASRLLPFLTFTEPGVRVPPRLIMEAAWRWHRRADKSCRRKASRHVHPCKKSRRSLASVCGRFRNTDCR